MGHSLADLIELLRKDAERVAQEARHNRRHYRGVLHATPSGVTVYHLAEARRMPLLYEELHGGQR